MDEQTRIILSLIIVLLGISISLVLRPKKPLNTEYTTAISIFTFGIISILVSFFPEEVMSFITEYLAGILGVFSAFYLDRTNESKRNRELSEKIVNNLIVELNNNLDILNLLSKMPSEKKKKRFITFQTTVWEMHKESLEFDNMDIYILK
jgi:hypothetical protein